MTKKGKKFGLKMGHFLGSNLEKIIGKKILGRKSQVF